MKLYFRNLCESFLAQSTEVGRLKKEAKQVAMKRHARAEEVSGVVLYNLLICAYYYTPGGERLAQSRTRVSREIR